METQTTIFWMKNKTWIIIVGVIVVIFLYGISKYNSFIAQNNAITAQWAQVENQLQRRFDLIPNLVNTVKGVAKQEQTVYLGLADARSRYLNAGTPDAKAQAASGVESALVKVLAIAESNPVLASSGAYRDLMVSLEGTENRVAVERMKYNDDVRVFNTGVQVFPSSVIAKMFGFTAHEYFNVPAAAQVNPTVNF